MKLPGLSGTGTQIRAWLIDLFASAINRTTRPEDRTSAIEWLGRSRSVLAREAPAFVKARELHALIDSRAAAKAIAGSVAESFANYRQSRLPLSVKVALPATLAAMPFLGGQAAGLAAFGGAVGVPVAILFFLGESGITAIIEAVAADPDAGTQIAQLIATIIEDERLRRISAKMKEAMRSGPTDPLHFAMPAEEAALRQRLLSMDPFDFERHVMSFFRTAGCEAWNTRKSNDFGVDGFAVHADGLLIVQCKRNSLANKVGRPVVQQFKGVAEEQNAARGFIVTTSGFTDEAIESAAMTGRIRLADMDALIRWHALGRADID